MKPRMPVVRSRIDRTLGRLFRLAGMQMTPHAALVASISFDEAWSALSPATQMMLAHLRKSQGQQPQVIYPVAHRQSS